MRRTGTRAAIFSLASFLVYVGSPSVVAELGSASPATVLWDGGALAKVRALLAAAAPPASLQPAAQALA